MPLFNSTQEILINEEPLRSILSPLLPLASGIMLKGLPLNTWLSSFSKKQDLGTIMMGEGLMSQQLFSEVQLTQEALTHDNALQIRWCRGSKPLEVGYLNAKGGYAEICGFDTPLTETTETLEYFGIKPQLLKSLQTCTERLVVINRSGALSALTRESIIGVALQFALKGLNIRVFSEILSGDIDYMFDQDSRLRLNTEQQLIKFPLTRILPQMLSARVRP